MLLSRGGAGWWGLGRAARKPLEKRPGLQEGPGRAGVAEGLWRYGPCSWLCRGLADLVCGLVTSVRQGGGPVTLNPSSDSAWPDTCDGGSVLGGLHLRGGGSERHVLWPRPSEAGCHRAPEA